MKKIVKQERLPPMQALRSFDAVARLGSVNAAAEELHVTHGAISHQIHALEIFIGVPLIERKGRRQNLTDLGRTYAYQVRQTLDALADMTATLRSRIPAGILRVSVLPSFAQGWLVPRLVDWVARYPDIRLHIDATMGFTDFAAGDCDCAIRFGHGQWPDLEAHHIMGDSLVLVAAPALFPDATGKPDLRTILSKPRLQSSESWPLWLTEIGSDETLQHEPCLSFTDSTHLLEAARNGLGIALERASIADDLVRRGELRVLETPHVEHPSHYFLVRPRRSRAKPKVEKLLEWLLDMAGRA